MKKTNNSFPLGKVGLLSLAIASVTAQAQQNNEPEKSEGDIVMEEVVVSASYRASLQHALGLKRDNVGFVDAITAEDVGKFPDQNLAESLQRISGIQISRNLGEGQQISLRGLGPSFSRIVLDGMPVSVASEGSADSGRPVREFDFDLFPSEIFNAVEVYKSPRASIVEGGLAGTVNMRTAHPFDYDGMQATYSLETVYSEQSEENDPKGSFLFSNTWNDTFGVLVSAAKNSRTFEVEGFDTQGWARGRIAPDVNPDVGRTGFDWNLTDGNQSGLSDDELRNARVPRMSRPDFNVGERDRTGLYAAFQWKPQDNLNLNLDIMNAKLDSQFARYVNNMVVRGTREGRADTSGWIVPRNFVLGGSDGQTVVSGTLDGVRFWSENREYETEVDFNQVAFSGDWVAHEFVKLDWKIAKSASDYKNENISYFFNSDPTVSSFTVENELVVVNPGIDLIDGSNYVFDGFRVDRQEREETNNTYRFDVTFGDPDNNLRLGILNHLWERDRKNYHWGTGESSEILALAGFPAGTVAADLDPSSIGKATPEEFGDSLGVTPGYSKWFVPDFAAIRAMGITPGLLQANVPLDTNGTGVTEEDTFAGYIEANLTSEFLGREIRINAGVRAVNTEVTTVSNFRNGDGVYSKTTESVDYSAYLPSFSLVANLTDDLLFRFAGSRSMTRPSPDELNSRVSVSRNEPRVDKGNPNLDPFFADQLDLGLEWYFDTEALVAINYYYKDINGFTESVSTEGRFGDSGLLLEDLDAEQLAFMVDGLDTLVEFRTKDNSSEKSQIDGLELLYQQPLDMILPGLGVQANFTKVNFAGDRGVTGLSDQSYNIVTYFERENYSLRLSYNYRSEYPLCITNCRDGQPQGRYQSAAGYLDFAATYLLPFTFGHEEIELSFKANNLTDEQEISYWATEDTMRLLNKAGSQYTFGIKGKF
jgi:TonB-dependent receptor